MHFTLVATTLASLAAAVPVAPLSFPLKRASNTTVWPVHNFSVGCSPAACVYDFNVWRPAGPSIPGFNTSCTGNDFTSDYQACSDKSVYARILPEPDHWQVDVRQTYATDQDGGFIQASANGTVDETTPDFVLTVYSIEGAE